MTNRLVCVSNRVMTPRSGAAAGGLVVGVQFALRRSGGLWFGWSGELTEQEPAPVTTQVRDGIAYATTDLRSEEFRAYYDGFANEALWPLLHYMPNKFRFNPQEREAYENVNRFLARRLVPLLRPNDLLWVHDYHLIPFARCLREAGVDLPVGFFLHTPFPHVETLRVLPTYAELVRDLVQYDVVGFQTASDLDSFLSAVGQVFAGVCRVAHGEVHLGDRRVRCEVFPIGVDVETAAGQAKTACQSDAVRRMVESLMQRQLVIGVDRLDYSKGLVERFGAYENFLDSYPEHRRRLTYLQIAPLSRKNVPSYVEIRRALEQAAGRTNGRFADTDWTPIRYLNRNVPHATLMGLFRCAQVGLVTPLRDGMNLVAKEYLAAQDPDDPGVLVLSNLAGAAHELTDALLINPYDSRAVGGALQRALTMPLQERRERHASLLAALRRNTIQHWADRFVSTLREQEATRLQAPAAMPRSRTAV
jgi:trehalose 6-phosphate synthase